MASRFVHEPCGFSLFRDGKGSGRSTRLASALRLCSSGPLALCERGLIAP
jgi:hypothetical protein